MDFIDNSSIDGSFLNKSKLQPNRKSTVVLAKNVCRFVKSLPLDWIITGCEGALTRDEANYLDNHSDISEMKKSKKPQKYDFLVPEYKLCPE